METPEKERFRVSLDQDAPADEAVKKILRVLQAGIVSHEAEIRSTPDPRSLHQFRVATRRTRAILGELRGVFPIGAVGRFRKDFEWLARQTGTLRDLDVFLNRIMEFDESPSATSSESSIGIRAVLESERKLERLGLIRALDKDRYGSLLASWRTFLSSPGIENEGQTEAEKVIVEVASERTWTAFCRVQKSSSEILKLGEVSADVIHRLRIACKKLRYLMEAFADLYDEEEVEDLITLFRRLQDSMGDFHDFDLQSRKLISVTEHLEREGRLDSETATAIIRFDEYLVGLKEQAGSAFRDDLRCLTGSTIQASFQRMYGAPSSP